MVGWCALGRSCGLTPARQMQHRFMVAMRVHKNMRTTHQPGRDGFHSVPNSARENGDAVERVPTGFMVPLRAQKRIKALHEPGRTPNVQR